MKFWNSREIYWLELQAPQHNAGKARKQIITDARQYHQSSPTAPSIAPLLVPPRLAVPSHAEQRPQPR
jgi:hypothetical protein